MHLLKGKAKDFRQRPLSIVAVSTGKLALKYWSLTECLSSAATSEQGRLVFIKADNQGHSLRACMQKFIFITSRLECTSDICKIYEAFLRITEYLETYWHCITGNADWQELQRAIIGSCQVERVCSVCAADFVPLLLHKFYATVSHIFYYRCFAVEVEPQSE